MDPLKRVSKVFDSAKQIPFDDSSRFIIMSDCHRGDGSWTDDFSRNQNLYFAALTYYFYENFTYIEIGDGDELWENKKLSDIISVHSDVFWLLSKFYNEGRMHLIFGNHDLVKKSKKYAEDNLYEYFEEREKRNIPLFKDITPYEGLVLSHSTTGNKIFLIHGHQVDFLNGTLWKFARFLVRYLWRPLQAFGVNDPTRTAKNYHRKAAVENKLTEWVKKEKHMLIAGHTHKPMFPEPGEAPYFNDGSTVHPRCITGIEIADGFITLVKWSVNTTSRGTMYVGRDELAGPEKLENYFGKI